MKVKRTKPKPIQKKKVRNRKPDWDTIEAADFEHDRAERKRKEKGPSPEASKLLKKKVG